MSNRVAAAAIAFTVRSMRETTSNHCIWHGQDGCWLIGKSTMTIDPMNLSLHSDSSGISISVFIDVSAVELNGNI